MPLLQVRHRTVYSYKRPVGFGDHRWMFRPRDSQEQRLVLAEGRISPEPSELAWIHDVFSNQIAIASFASDSTELAFESNIVLEHTPQSGLSFRTDDSARLWPFDYDAESLDDLAAYRLVQYPDPSVTEWARKLAPSGGSAQTGDLLLRLNSAVRETCRYTRRNDPGTQPPALTLARASGTCRDFALLMIEAARVLGFAARFVTGYIYVPSRDHPGVLGGGATHAWVQVFLPGAGWVEFDPTNGIVGNQDLIRVGVARDPRQARPLYGSFIGERTDYIGMEVDVLVTKPPFAAEDPGEVASHIGALSFRG